MLSGVLGDRRALLLLALLAAAALVLLVGRGGPGGDQAKAGLIVPCVNYPDIPAPPAKPTNGNGRDQRHPVIFVGNNWDGTADIISTRRRSFRKLARINIVPDYRERILEICANPVDLCLLYTSPSPRDRS